MGGTYQDKIVDLQALLAFAEQARAGERSIVLCHGCFDIVHPGHIRYLENARRHGDFLVVSITGDSAIDKEADRPYIPEELRAGNLAAFEFVDLVYIDPHHTAAHLIEALRPNVYVKGEEYQRLKDPRFLAEQAIIESYGGRVLFASGDVVYSSTELIRRMGRSRLIDTDRLRYVCRRHRLTEAVLSGHIERFAGRRVVVAGDVVLDRYVMCDALDVARESPMMSLKQLGERSFVGGAGAVAAQFAELGAEVRLGGSFGADESSRWVLDELARRGIQTTCLLPRPRLAQKTRFLVEDAKLYRLEQADNHPLDTLAVRHARAWLMDQAAWADAVVFCDAGYGAITDGLLEESLSELRRRVGIIVADVTGRRGNLLRYKRVDLFCPTERQVRAAVRNFDDGLSAVAWELLHATAARHLVATLGRRGVVAFQRQSGDPQSADWNGRLRSEYFQALSDRAVDTLGCGAALLCGCTLALCSGAEFIQAVYLGHVLAGLEAAEFGHQAIDCERLRLCLQSRPELEALDPQPGRIENCPAGAAASGPGISSACRLEGR